MHQLFRAKRCISYLRSGAPSFQQQILPPIFSKNVPSTAKNGRLVTDTIGTWVKKKKFIGTVREAEKSVLVFGLDLGRVPTMNTGTLARKVTEDITSKASVVDGKCKGYKFFASTFKQLL